MRVAAHAEIGGATDGGAGGAAAAKRGVSAVSAATADGHGSASLPLGRDGVAFSFDEDSPCPVSWCTARSSAGGGAASGRGGGEADLAEVRAFVVRCVTGG